ncbi:MAG TPA: aminotransferase class IV [Symbiobacteriaceae bacterium]|nr:aminotransferase class IV [Symbiobacteriaceae bacterium]
MNYLYLDIGGRGPGLVPEEQALVPVADRGFCYGDGLFETMLLIDGEIGLLPLHLERMTGSARALGIPFDSGHARQGIQAVVEAIRDSARGEHFLRMTLTRGSAGPRGYQPPPDPAPTLVIAIAPFRRPGGPMSAITSSYRVGEHSPLAAHKTISALDKVLARGEAFRAGCDEAVMLNLQGRVAEGAASNLFIVRKGLWMTPPLADGCLPGIMRQRVLALTGGVQWRIAPEDLFRCDGVYLTNALMGCMPLAALDGRGLPWGDPPAFHHRLWTLR